VTEGWVSNFIICPELSLAITSGSDGLLCLVDCASGDLIRVLNGHQHGVWNLLLLSPHLLVSSGFDETIRIWDIQAGQSLAVLSGHKHRLEEMLLTQNHNYLITRDKAGRVISWSIDWRAKALTTNLLTA